MLRLCFFLCCVWSCCGDRLISLTIVYRHGERTPFRLPNNYSTSFAKRPLAQLTLEGIRQHQRLGRYLRHRYKRILPNEFDVDKVRIRSSDYDRTLMSAVANGQEMFSGYPVAVHTVPKDEDYLLGRSSRCPAFRRWLNAIWDRPLNVLKTELFFSGPVAAKLRERIPDVKHRNYFGIADFLLLESERDPSHWVWPLRADVERHLTWMFLTEVCDKTVQRLRAGALIDEIASNIECTVKCRKNSTADCSCKSVLVYSGHDFTLGYLLGALGVECNFSIPPFASALLIELRKDRSAAYGINVEYIKNNDSEAFASQVLRKNMSIVDFQELIRPVRTDHLKEECLAAQNLRARIKRGFYYSALVLSMLLAVAAFIALVAQRKSVK